MFNRLPGTMLDERHTHECEQGLNCGRALLHDTAAIAQSHRLFNPAQPVAVLDADTGSGTDLKPVPLPGAAVI
jgi:hypothetical protein